MNDEVEKDKLTDSVSLELDTDLRLHPQRLELGKAELLTDALILPYSNIEKQLAQFAISASQNEEEHLRKSMKNYLGRLNANPHIPLSFRMKVLNHFERELELFDGEMTTAVLNAHKIGVDLVQKAARDDPSYYKYLVDMVSNAIELAVKLLLISLEHYRAPAVITTRQFFELARLGLNVAGTLDRKLHAKQQRLYKAICDYELLRTLDFYDKTRIQQKKIWQELQSHISALQPKFYRDGERFSGMESQSFLVTNINRPNEPAEFLNSLPDPLNKTCIIIPMDAFMDRLYTALKRVESVLKNMDKQKIDLHTEEALQTTLIGGSAIISTLRREKQEDHSSSPSKAHIMLEWDADRAISSAFSNVAGQSKTDTTDADAWSVISVSENGINMERMSSTPLPHYIGSLVGLKWDPNTKQPALGFVCRFKEVKPGEQRIDIQFLRDKCQLTKAAIYSGSGELSAKRSWPILIKPGTDSFTAIFPDPQISRKMVFSIFRDGKSAYFKVKKVISSGPNSSVCQMVRTEFTTNTDK
jgi:hypothetical protein